MHTLETLQTQIRSIEELRAVVRTMKALAMVHIRQYEQARTSLTDYNHTIELGLQALLHHRHFSETQISLPLTTPPKHHGLVGIILFGSDHGLCGSFNEQIVAYALAQLHHRQIPPDRRLVAAVGARLIPHLETAHQPIQATFSLPSSLAGSLQLIQTLLLTIEQWRFRQHSDQVTATSDEITEIPHSYMEYILLFYNQHLSTTAYQPFSLQLLPLDRVWLHQLEQRPWDSAARPSLSMNWEPLFSKLIRQYLLISLYRATVESLASENAARLTAMQTAEKNIEERLTLLNAEYRQQRQNTITGELLDIVSGFEALKTS
ncbi:F0F1 ATP synthase subunit gamma [Leptothermofonsia sp. ETS-13]|uniref:F0F1 ATP synthase subunit gamma n=1 Tax=Leptothermofonsia sp. ETS-13 TaxID=3035696 RepID=UPI003BA2FF80